MCERGHYNVTYSLKLNGILETEFHECEYRPWRPGNHHHKTQTGKRMRIPTRHFCTEPATTCQCSARESAMTEEASPTVCVAVSNLAFNYRPGGIHFLNSYDVAADFTSQVCFEFTPLGMIGAWLCQHYSQREEYIICNFIQFESISFTRQLVRFARIWHWTLQLAASEGLPTAGSRPFVQVTRSPIISSSLLWLLIMSKPGGPPNNFA